MDQTRKTDAFLLRKFGNKAYTFALAAVKSIPKHVYKERNFNLVFKLVDSEKKLVLNCTCCSYLGNPIPVTLSLYDPSDPSIPVTLSRLNEPIIKGNTESSIYHGKCEFRKVHIREVTSCRPDCCFYAVIEPKLPSFSYPFKESEEDVMIDYRTIKPLVVVGVVVRAKKR